MTEGISAHKAADSLQKPSLIAAGLIFSQVLGMVGLAGARGAKGPRFPQALREMGLHQQPVLPGECSFTLVWLSARKGVLERKCCPAAMYQ